MKQIPLGPLLFISVITLALVVLHQRRPEPVAGETLRIAANIPLTGDLAVYGTAIQEGVEFAVSSLGESTKRLVHFEWEDNASSARQAVTIARKQLSSGPNVYLSGVKPQYMAIHKILARKGMPHFAWIFDVDLRPEGEENFRTWVNFKVEAPLFINYAGVRAASRIAIVYVSLPHTDRQYHDLIIPALKDKEGTELLVQNYQADLIDFNTIALKVRQFSPDLIILSGFQRNLISMVRAFRNLHLISEGNTIATYDLLDAAPLLRAEDLEGVRVSAPSFLLSGGPKVEHWGETFRNKYGKSPSYTHAYAFDMAAIIFDAAARSQRKGFSPEALFSAIAGTDIPGITGRLKFDEQGDLLPSVELGVFRNGKLVRG
jgi:branched-chain amino acid transport system substrate-binding protein